MKNRHLTQTTLQKWTTKQNPHQTQGQNKRSPIKSISRKSQKHESSRQRSQTEQIIDHIQVSEKVCPQLIMLSMLDTINAQAIMTKIKKLMRNYSKQSSLELIEQNAKFHGGKNVRNLKKIDDDLFWKTTFPKILKLIQDKSQEISGSVDMLPSRLYRMISITQSQALLILAQMFLCILPKQLTCKYTSFAEWFQIHQYQEQYQDNINFNKAKTRLEKLKCIINYFNMMFSKKSMDSEIIQIQRTSNQVWEYLSLDRKISTNLMAVDISREQQKIQDYYKKHAMVDFANKQLGGGVLGNGAVQEQILFVIFPQAIISKILCEKMDDNQAIIIYNAQRFNKYTGYSYDFKYAGSYQQSSIINQRQISIIVAIDATDFSKTNDKLQYNKKNIRRQINKAYAGFSGIQAMAPLGYGICTGRWGCGAFHGNQVLKFIIQWIACSQAQKEMIYLTQGEEMEKQLTMLVKEMKKKTTTDLLSILDEYYNLIAKKDAQIELLDYFKDLV